MAASRLPGSTSRPAGLVPSRTPGPLGINDQADPNKTSLLGDTPGPVGWRDGADPVLTLYTPADLYSNLVCRAPDSRPLAAGSDLQSVAPAAPVAAAAAAAPAADPGSVTLKDAQEMALKITTYFEGGVSMNYKALADDSDGQGTSFGLIQWNFGKNTLGPLLKLMLDKDSSAFAACFGPDADYETLKTALNSAKQADELKWARDRIKNKRAAWQAAFTAIGSNAGFNAIQLAQAAAQYHPKALAVIADIRGIQATLMAKIEFRSYAAIFDLCVQQGSLAGALDNIKSRVGNEKPTTQLELMKIVVTERGRTAKAQWRTDCISRRMGILTGASYKSTEGESVLERKNSQLTLIAQFGAKYVPGL
jgi:hypothetical protein